MRHACWSAMLLLAFLVGCAASPLTEYRLHSNATPCREDALQIIACCAAQMEESVEAIRRLRDSSVGESEYLLPREHDLLEQRLAVFLSCRRELNQIAQREPLNSFLRRESLSNRNRCDVALATLSVEDPLLWRAMNQSFHRSRITEGSCDRILHEVTAARDPSLPQEQQEQLQRVISRRGVLLPAVENELNHAPPAEVLLDMGHALSWQVRRCQSVLISGTGRIKNPVARPLTFSEEQQRRIRDALQPGDVLLTYTEGNASNLFIPGKFKHAATFVGTPAERRRAGLSPEKLLAVAGPNVRVLKQVCNESMTKTGEEADVVESLAEGVQFCNFQT
ncbi:MAG: hypothetical protein K8R36_04275, partial [Planctomycetales bacterium]|nr:hypothetical protein [Planctomycetales bacterium]